MANVKISAMPEPANGLYSTDKVAIVQNAVAENYATTVGELVNIPPTPHVVHLTGSGATRLFPDYYRVIALVTSGNGATENVTINKPTFQGGEPFTVYVKTLTNAADKVELHPGGAGVNGVYITGTNDPTSVFADMTQTKLQAVYDSATFVYAPYAWKLDEGASNLSNGVTLGNKPAMLKGWANLPTADPHVAGQLWRSGTALQVSIG